MKIRRGPSVRFALLLVIFAAGISAALFTPLGEYLKRENMGKLVQAAKDDPWAFPVFIGAYAGMTVLAIPGSILTMTSGALFGIVLGILAVAIGATAGASGAFWVGRLLGREWVERKLGGGKRFERLQESMQRHGFLRVLQLRLIPLVPFNALNFGSGMTRVGFVPFFFGTLFGILPGTSIYVYVGYSSSQYWIKGGAPEAQEHVLLVNVLVSLGLLVLITVIPIFLKKLRTAEAKT